MAKGDHIKVKRLRGCYKHHGIDMGDGTVVHYSGEPLHYRNARICRVTLDEFCQGVTPIVVQYAQALRTPEEVVREAEKHIGEQSYRLWRNNCEHFATYCITGQRKSRQVKRVARVAVGLAASSAVLTMVVASELIRARRRRA